MLALLACAAVLQVPIDQPPRLRTILENGAVLLVEPMPREPSVTLSLWLSAGSYRETPARNGIRHLLEHFLARGPKRDLDQRLESVGGFLRASTYRDAMNFEVIVPKDRLTLGLQALREVMTLPQISQEQIDKEVRVMRAEAETRGTSSALSSDAWAVAYDGKEPDPFGDFEVLVTATPQALRQAHLDLVRAEGTALVITGDVDMDRATTQAKEMLAFLPKGKPADQSRTLGKGGVVTATVGGEARACLTDGIRSTDTAAALMAGLAIASEIDGSFFIYTPSADPGLMIVGQTEDSSEFSERVKTLDGRPLYLVGRALAERWVRSQLAVGRGVGHLRGLLLSQGPALRPEILLENIAQVTQAQFLDAIERYRDDRSVRVIR